MRIQLLKRSGSLAALLVLGLPMMAQAPAVDSTELDLFELLNTPVSGASKREQRLIDSPQAIEVLTGDEIRQMGIYRIQDALKLMTSIDVLEADTGYSVIGMRGVMQEGQPRTVQLLIDGVPLYTPLGATYDINNLPVPVDLIERIEVMRGPSSTLYGANAVVGVIAITTKKMDKGIHGDIRASGADKSTSRSAGNVRWSEGGFGVLAGYSGASFGNSDFRTHKVGATSPENMWVTFDGAEKGAGHQSDKAHQSSAYSRLEYRSEATSVWFSAGQARKEISPVGQPPVTYMNYRYYNVGTFLAGWNQAWSKTFTTEVRMHRMTSQYGGGPAAILAVVLGDPGWNSEYTWGDLTSDQIDLQANWNPSQVLHFVFGADTRKIKLGKDVMHGISAETNESASGGFASMDWNITPTNTASVGFRAENESLGGSRISPRAVYVWNPSKSSVLRVAYLTSTRSPQYFEQRINFKAVAPLPAPYPPSSYPIFFTIQPNPDLKPEQTTNFEIGYRQMVGAVTLDMTAYQMKFKDLITQETTKITPLPPGLPPRADTQFQNTGNATNTGLEMSATIVLRKGWTTGLNVAVVDFKKDNPKPTDPIRDRFAYTSGTKANAWTRLSLDKWTGYLALQYVSATDVEGLTAYGPSLYEPNKRDAYLQYHLNVGYEILKGFSVNAYVRNGAKEFTEQGTTGPDRPPYYLAMRREMGLTAAYRF